MNPEVDISRYIALRDKGLVTIIPSPSGAASIFYIAQRFDPETGEPTPAVTTQVSRALLTDLEAQLISNLENVRALIADSTVKE